MEIKIKGNPKELAEWLAEFGGVSHKICQEYEERMVEMLIQSMQQQKKGNKITTEEVPTGGYFN